MEPLHIVQVTPFFDSKSYGGTERYVNYLSKELVKNGHYIDVFTTKKSTEIPYQSYYTNMTVHRFFSPWDVFGINPACIMLHKLLKIQNVDIFHVHSFIYFTTIQAAIAKMFRKIPTLLHIHGGVGSPPYRTGFVKEFAKKFYDFTLGRFVLSQADIIASVSAYDAEILENIIHRRKERIMIVNNAINLEIFPEIEPEIKDEKIITYIGDLEPWKGIVYYIEVIKTLLKKTKNLTFWFIGYGSLYLELKEKFKKEKRVKIYGAVEHSSIPDLLSKTSILVLPSFWEGSPTIIIEAMSMGIPVIASNIGDIPRLLKNGDDGILFEVGNSKSLEAALLNMVEDYSVFVNKAKRARKRIRNEFSFQNVTNQIEKLYYKLIKD